MSEYVMSSLMAELSESAKTRSVLVSEIPTLTNEDKIEIYFGKRVNGGGDIEKIIMLDKSTALITFGEEKVIQSVIEHGSHKLNGQTVEVTSLSSMLKKSKVNQPTNTDDVQKSFLSVTEELTDSDKKRSLVVVGIQRIRHVTDQIETHFRQQKNGGGDIKHVYLIDTDAALITFCKENVIDLVIEKSPHQLHGSEVEAMSFDTYRLKNSDVTPDSELRPTRVSKTLKEDVGQREVSEVSMYFH
ncbi:interferon-induced 35 kDa protein homolog [Antedon mediterranea]|uniref:interferon-induced 35 kDa protein homolog n=1 Tax=Antedon mediterranea TaxID=105859 RepID=UPI003AF752C7